MLNRLGELIGRLADRPLPTVLTTVAVGVLVGVFDYAADAFLSAMYSPHFHSASQAVIVGVGAALAVWFLMVARREMRNQVRDELFRLAELNHELRNALQVISYSHFSEADEADCEHNTMIQDTVRKMDETLKRIFPSVGVTRK